AEEAGMPPLCCPALAQDPPPPDAAVGRRRRRSGCAWACLGRLLAFDIVVGRAVAILRSADEVTALAVAVVALGKEPLDREPQLLGDGLLLREGRDAHCHRDDPAAPAVAAGDGGEADPAEAQLEHDPGCALVGVCGDVEL